MIEPCCNWVNMGFGTDGESASAVARKVFLCPVKLLPVGDLESMMDDGSPSELSFLRNFVDIDPFYQ